MGGSRITPVETQGRLGESHSSDGATVLPAGSFSPPVEKVKRALGSTFFSLSARLLNEMPAEDGTGKGAGNS